MVNETLPQPNFRRGLEIFVTRPVSLVVTLIIAVVLCLASFMILTFPLVAGYFFAVRHSRREEYFVDLNAILKNCGLLFLGIKHHFGQSYVLGFLGLVPAVALVLVPIVPLHLYGNEGRILSLVLQVLWLPGFFLAGGVFLYGFPHLVATTHGIRSLRHTLSAGMKSPLKTLAVGFVILFPIPGFVFHLLMVLTYPFLAAWAVGATADPIESGKAVSLGGNEKSGGRLLLLLLAGLGVAGGYFCVRLWGGVGLVAWLGICLAFSLMGALTTWRFALRMFGFVLGFVVVSLGGGTLLARHWGERIILPWIAVCIVVLILFQKRVFGGVPPRAPRP
jgi:hypothetical protein